MYLLALVLCGWWFKYPGRLLEHQFGYGVVYHLKAEGEAQVAVAQ